MGGEMKLYMGIDLPGWCFDRVFNGLHTYGSNAWKGIVTRRPILSEKGMPPPGPFRQGGIMQFLNVVRWGYLKNTWNDLCLPTSSSFQFFNRAAIVKEFSAHLNLIGAIGYVDRRMVPMLTRYKKPLFYCPTCVDPKSFYPMPELRQGLMNRKIRVGWAGSQIYWKNLKHVPEIEVACQALEKHIEFVRQDREADGQKSITEMNLWHNANDINISANEEDTCTPVPQIEAISCGVLPISTRCGERWRWIAGLDENLIIQEPTVDGIIKTLRYCIENKARLHMLGMELRKRHLFTELSWCAGEAKLQTEIAMRFVK